MIVVVGCDHGHQRKAQSCGGDGVEAFEREQKSKFIEIIERIVVENHPEIIGEEINQGADTFAADVAREHECRYVNIDMREPQRREAGIPRSYSDNRSGHAGAELERWDRIREQFMVDQTIRSMAPNQSALVICGRLHQNSLTRMFQNRGLDVRVVDLSAEPWYSEHWLEDYLDNADHYDDLDRQFKSGDRGPGSVHQSE